MTAIDECWGSGGDRLGLSDDRKESDGDLGKETKERKENRLRTTLLASIGGNIVTEWSALWPEASI